MPEINGFDHIHINVSDRKKSEVWYSKVLKLRRKKELEFWAEGDGPLVITDSTNTVNLALFESTKIQDTIVALNTSADGLQEWVAYLSNQGILVQPVDHDVAWSIYFKDLDGNPFEITTYEYVEFMRSRATDE